MKIQVMVESSDHTVVVEDPLSFASAIIAYIDKQTGPYFDLKMEKKTLAYIDAVAEALNVEAHRRWKWICAKEEDDV